MLVAKLKGYTQLHVLFLPFDLFVSVTVVAVHLSLRLSSVSLLPDQKVVSVIAPFVFEVPSMSLTFRTEMLTE